MMSGSRIGAHVGGVVSMVSGGLLISATLLVMNQKVHRTDEVRANIIADLEVQKKDKPPPPKHTPKPKPEPKRRARDSAPRPNLSTNLSGLGVGLALFQSEDFGGLGDDLVGDQGLSEDMVLTEEAVDRLPQPRPGNTQPKYPPRARAKGIEGRVVLSVLVGADGGVKNVSVYSATPEGVFEEEVLSAVRTWSFEPALYKGQPVPMTFKLPLAFALN